MPAQERLAERKSRPSSEEHRPRRANPDEHAGQAPDPADKRHSAPLTGSRKIHVEPQDNVRVPFGGQLHVESAA